MKCFAIILILVLSSCSLYTDISYRDSKKQEYIREDGFVLKCKEDENKLVFSTFTPESWGDGFYYGYLDGSPTHKHLKINSIDLRFVETGDTLNLQEIVKDREYIYTSPNLKKIIQNNKHLKALVSITDLETSKTETREFLLTRKKHTFFSGTFPH